MRSLHPFWEYKCDPAALGSSSCNGVLAMCGRLVLTAVLNSSVSTCRLWTYYESWKLVEQHYAWCGTVFPKSRNEVCAVLLLSSP